MGTLKKVILFLFFLQALVNLIPVFAPELGFDALWYHLTLPKLWLLQGRWYFPGGLLYYSAMPRLAETLFIPALALLGTTGPKLLQYLAGLLSAYFTFRLARLYFRPLPSLLAASLFYHTWVIAWQSGSAYIDLIRTLFELLGFYFIILHSRKKNPTHFLLSGLFYGLAIGTKWHALASLLLASVIFAPTLLPVGIFFALPWFLLAYFFTGNPLHPLLSDAMTTTQLAQVPATFFSPLTIITRLTLIPYHLLKPIDDHLNPLLAVTIPLGLFLSVHSSRIIKKIALFSLMGLILWQLTPPPSTRYLLPYLPMLAFISLLGVRRFPILIPLSLLSFILIIGGRTAANYKYLPYLSGQLSRNQFLTVHASRLPGAFIDSDNWVEQNLPPNSKVLIRNLNLLYYFPRNFDHESFADPSYPYQYLVSIGENPNSIKGELLHTNSLGIQIFKL